jgi:3-deoxy-D-manno-octulosonate 8-phosphate phosphatase (KDO 8-P phosphatase)
MRRSPVDEASIRLLILDVDGVLTDGRLYYTAEGETLKVFHVRDGQGIKLVQSAGIEVGVITGRNSHAVARRCHELGIRMVAQGVEDKLAVFTHFRSQLELAAAACACIGDDLPDVAIMEEVGLAFAVADAHPVARQAAHYVTSHTGGNGAVREVCDRLLAARAARP